MKAIIHVLDNSNLKLSISDGMKFHRFLKTIHTFGEGLKLWYRHLLRDDYKVQFTYKTKGNYFTFL